MEIPTSYTPEIGIFLPGFDGPYRCAASFVFKTSHYVVALDCLPKKGQKKIYVVVGSLRASLQPNFNGDKNEILFHSTDFNKAKQFYQTHVDQHDPIHHKTWVMPGNG